MARTRRIKLGESVSISFSAREKTLIADHTLADPEYVERLESQRGGRGYVGRYTLDDLDDLLGYVAAEANHSADRRLRDELDALYARVANEMKKYDDGQWQT